MWRLALFLGASRCAGLISPARQSSALRGSRVARRVAPTMIVEHLDTSFLTAVIDGSTCIGDTSWFCNTQNAVQDSIVNLHGFVHDTVGIQDNSFGISIIMFTFFCRLAIFPLNYISYEVTEKTKALKPYTEKIKARYGDDQQAVNLATAKLYDLSDTNPLAGCLPSLLQIPVFIALYRSVLNLAFAGELNEGFLWLPSLQGPTYDTGRGIGWLTENWVNNVPSLGWHDTLCFLALPAALVLTQSFSMQMMTPKPDPNDKAAERANRVLKYLPLMIGWFSANVPAGLGLYWMTSNLFSVASSAAVKGYLAKNPPTLDIDMAELGLDDESAGVKLPATMDEALQEARLNPKPNRIPRRMGIAPLPNFNSDLLKMSTDARAASHSSSSGDLSSAEATLEPELELRL